MTTVYFACMALLFLAATAWIIVDIIDVILDWKLWKEIKELGSERHKGEV